MNWMKALVHMASPTQLDQVIKLWIFLQEVALQPHPDTITWRWTTSGNYSMASAYNCQFWGSSAPFRTDKLWNAAVEPKCRFFAWLVLHGKVLTADNLAIRGWPHDPTCQLCFGAPETANHLCKECPYTIAIWNLVNSWDNNINQIQGPMIGDGRVGWCPERRHGCSK